MQVRLLAPLVLLLGVLFALAAAQSCTNNLSNTRCQQLVRSPGCGKLNVRLDCRRACNVCDSFELPNPSTLRDTAVLYGGNHIVTFDRLPWDCTAQGELTLVRNDRNGLRVTALSKTPPGMRNPLIKAVSIRGLAGTDTLQIGVNENQSRGASSVGQCRLIYWVGNTRLTDAQVAQLGGWGGINLIDQFEPFLYKMDVSAGARVTVSLGYGREQGCYFDRVIVKIPIWLKNGIKGLMGTPDNNFRNDWHNNNGLTYSLPGKKARYLQNAYNYCRNSWCTTNPNSSFLKYQGHGSFSSNMRCRNSYSGFSSFNSATTEMRRVCGQNNYECLHDALSTGKASTGVETNRLTGEMESATVVFEGLRIEPRALRANRPTTVAYSVKLPGPVPGLEFFGVFQLNENTLQRSSGPLFFLRDSGDVAEGDDRAGDNVYTNVNAITLGNGFSAGFQAVPFINGSYRFGNRNYKFTLPLANRGYSVASGVTIPSPNNLRFELEVVSAIFIEVKYLSPEDQNDLDTGTKFLGGSVGFQCPGSPFIDFTSGDDTSTGGIETANVQIGRAWNQGRWSTSTVINLHAHWFSGNTGSGPITVTIVAKQRGTDRPRANASMSMAVTPGKRAGCAASSLDSRVGRLTINRNAAGKYVFRLIPNP